MLWMLSLVPLMMGLYFLSVLHHKKKSFLTAAFQAHRKQSSVWLKYGLALMFLLGLIAFIISFARPRAVLMLPTRMESIMLAIDTSGSMGAQDISPSRIEAAQSAITQFIAAQSPHVKIGVVTIASTAALSHPPTADRDSLRNIVERLPLQTGSALGSGILIALTELIPGTGIDVQKILTDADRPSPPTDTGRPLDMTRRPNAAARVAPGSNKSYAIVLLSDGQSNIGPDPIKMAQLAADFGVRIHTVGVGTPEGTILKAQGVSMRVKLDESTLKKISEITLGDYYRASSAIDLNKIYQSLSPSVRIQKHQTTEVTAFFIGLGLLLILGAVLGSLYRTGRVL
jgi:Ca-activated chloride channel family protein